MRATVLAITLVLTGAGCDIGPQPIVAGDPCARCHMPVADERWGAELITRTGLTRKYDAIECLVRDLRDGVVAEAEIASLWVVPFDAPGSLVPAEGAVYVHAGDLRSPMGLNLTAFTTGAAAQPFVEGGDNTLDWSGVRARVAAEPTADAEAGHGETHAHDRIASPPAGEEIVVSADGASGSVARAIRAAPAGATVRVPRGVYAEPTIVIDRPLTLIGAPGAVLDGRGDTALLEIRADDVEVRGLTFRNVATSFVEDRAAVRAVGVRRCAIVGNRFEATFFAIYLEGVDGCTVEGNALHGSGDRETTAGNGVHAWNSRGVVVRDNEMSGHRDGIYFEFVRHGRVEGNRSAGNHRYGLHFMFSDSCEYIGNAFVGNGAGVAVMYARDVVMHGNTFERNRGTATYGLLLKDIRDARLSGNRFVENTIGLLAEGSDRLEIRDNAFRSNGWAVKVMANAVDNRFTGNTFVGNAFDVATNSTRTSSTFEGNYWDAYRGYDLDRDGFGDVPFRPVRLFSLIVEHNPAALALLRGLFVDILDAAERVLPVLTPETLVDARPRMEVP